MDEKQLQLIKQHLLERINDFPEDQRKIVEEKILSMNSSEMEKFIEQNQLSHLNEEQECIFCQIAQNKIKSYKIAEDENFFAVLEINPVAKAHTLVLPKKHLSLKNIPDSKKFVQQISGKLTKSFAFKKINTENSEIQGHAIINLIPETGEEKARRKAEEKELVEILSKLKEQPAKEEEIKKPEITVEKKPEQKSLPKLKLRIP